MDGCTCAQSLDLQTAFLPQMFPIHWESKWIVESAVIFSAMLVVKWTSTANLLLSKLNDVIIFLYIDTMLNTIMTGLAFPFTFQAFYLQQKLKSERRWLVHYLLGLNPSRMIILGTEKQINASFSFQASVNFLWSAERLSLEALRVPFWVKDIVRIIKPDLQGNDMKKRVLIMSVIL